MLDIIAEMLSYKFIVRALVAGTLVALCASLLGVSLVLKRYSMIGDGLSHVGFAALAIASAMNAAPLAVAIPVVIVAAFLLLRMNSASNLRGDAALALLTTGSLAVGVMAVSLSSGSNIDVYNYMFGSILAMSTADVFVAVVLSAAVLILYVIFYSKIFAVTFDEDFARAIGINTAAYNMLIALLTAVTIVLGMRLMGTLLVSALVVFPSLSSMRVFRSFRSVVVSSAILSVACFFVGLVISYSASTPTGATVVCIDIAAFAVFSVIGMLSGKFRDANKKQENNKKI